MKLKKYCDECSCPTESVNPTKLTIVCPKGKQYLIEMTDRCLYEFICEKGHLNRFFISNPKYELLFEMGLCAYYKGFYREAVLDFAASLERFYENCINIFVIKRFQNTEKYDNILQKLWKPISKQSERQYGAFLSIFLISTGHMSPLFEEKQVELRNKVTHKGYFPTKEETLRYAHAVAKYIIEIYSDLTNNFNVNELNHLRYLETLQINTQLTKEIREKGLEHEKIQGNTIFSFFRSHYSLTDETWFDKMLKDFEKNYILHYEI